jgi:hypothetical protein
MRRFIKKLMPHLLGFVLLFSVGFLFVDITNQSDYFKAMSYSVFFMALMDTVNEFWGRPPWVKRREYWILGGQIILTAVKYLLDQNS